jgi:katanin p80 WD40 repeat-containing subunit B1
MHFLVCPNFDLLTQLIAPYALGVLPKANFFAELVHSIDDNPVNGSTVKSVRAVATAHPKSSYKVQESGIGMALNN